MSPRGGPGAKHSPADSRGNGPPALPAPSGVLGNLTFRASQVEKSVKGQKPCPERNGGTWHEGYLGDGGRKGICTGMSLEWTLRLKASFSRKGNGTLMK